MKPTDTEKQHLALHIQPPQPLPTCERCGDPITRGKVCTDCMTGDELHEALTLARRGLDAKHASWNRRRV